MPAAAALGPAHQLEEQAPLVRDHGRVACASPLEQAAPQRHVAGRHEQQPERGLAVAAGAPDLLVVGLDRAGRREVDDGAHVGAVDAHAERVGGDDDLERARRGTRCCAACARGPARGPRGRPRRASRAPRAARLLLGALARRRVDDGHAARRARARPAPRRAARRPARSRSRAPPTSSARRRRFGRAKPRTSCGVSAGRPRRARISSRTTGVAVAVQASTRGARAARPAARRSPGTPGRKSWPHSLMQWASSTATSGHRDAAQQAAEARRTTSRSGAT